MKASVIKFQKNTVTFPSAHFIKMYGDMVGIAPRIGNLGIRWRLTVSFHLARFIPRNGPWHPLNIRTGGSHSCSGGFGEEKKIPCHNGESNQNSGSAMIQAAVTGISPGNAGFIARPAQWWVQKDCATVCSQYFLRLLSVSFHLCSILIYSFVCHRRYTILTKTRVVKQQFKKQNHHPSLVYFMA